MKRVIEGIGIAAGIGLAAVCGINLFKDIRDNVGDIPCLDEIEDLDAADEIDNANDQSF